MATRELTQTLRVKLKSREGVPGGMESKANAGGTFLATVLMRPIRMETAGEKFGKKTLVQP